MGPHHAAGLTALDSRLSFPGPPHRTGFGMAKPNYAHQKKQREQAAKKKRDEKQQRRQEKKDEPPRPA